MKILIDIGHPAHVHYFRNAIDQWKEMGHHVVITARERKYVGELLKHYGLPYINKGKGSDSFLGKLSYMFLFDLKLLFVSMKHRPDIYVSFASAYAGQVATLVRKPHICLNDTEHSDRTHSIFTYPFSNLIITPHCYMNDLGPKQIRMNSVIEGFYLGEKRFQADQDFAKSLKGPDLQDYVIVRFVSWTAHHDLGAFGLSDKIKRNLISLLQKKYKVYVSTEGEMPSEFSEFALTIPVHKMHDALAGAAMFVGESGTMASESAYLGTPVVYINSLPLMGYLKFEQKVGLLKHFSNSDGVIEYIKDLMNQPDLSEKSMAASKKMRDAFSDATDFLISTVEKFNPAKRNG